MTITASDLLDGWSQMIWRSCIIGKRRHHYRSIEHIGRDWTIVLN